ncbi:hypothetical protein LNP05_17890 [Klebsiella pneumoniae subsp. pneumoniae]|nr:hypothetical protein [Klebsiella pneumoniae subsp. pneumoniae]
MMDYQTAVRGAFFDIAGVAETPDEVAAQARYLDDGLLFLQEGKIIALLPWLEGEAFLHPLKGYVDLPGASCCCRVLSIPTFTIRRPR